MNISHELKIGKSLGKIVDGETRKQSYFSPNCCYESMGDTNLLPIVNGVNIVTCNGCGTVYRITVAGGLRDYKRIIREIVEDHRIEVLETAAETP